MSDTATVTAESRAWPLLTAIDQAIGEDLREVDDRLTAELASDSPCVADILRHISRFRGKRLRPMLLLLSARACGGIRPEHHTLAAVVEMIHLATLVHDDVLDDAETRRHVATVNARWNNETSVLFGDYLFTHAFHLAASLDTTYACRQIGHATNHVCVGELTQVHERGNLELTEETYYAILDGKTAELCALCGHLGAYFAGASQETVRALEQYGRSLGLAFQIADDRLDLWGDSRQTGKTLGSDLQKQKLTLPLIRLLATASEQDAHEIRRILDHPAPDTRDRLEPFLRNSDALAYTTAAAERLVEDACDRLTILPPSPARDLLHEIATFAITRSH